MRALRTLEFFTSEIVDRFVRENFTRLLVAVKRDPLLKADFQFFEFSGVIPVDPLIAEEDHTATYTQKHGLLWQPKDVILLSHTSNRTITWDYDAFNRETVKFTVAGGSGPWRVRLFLGRYEENPGR